MKTDNIYKPAYDFAIQFTSSHYENFPVVSFFIPHKLKKHIAVIYQFARQADDIADEGNDAEEEKLQKLKVYKKEFTDCLSGNCVNDFWGALKNTIDIFNLEHENFYNLLRAFKLDCTKKRFRNYDELLKYCSYSANPVGRIILELYGIKDEKIIPYSDSICTALQLTNFYQDVSFDYGNGRIYLPEDELRKHHVPQNVFELKRINVNFKSLMLYQIERVRNLFVHGKNILKYLPRSLRFQIKWTILGGEKILQKIKDLDYDVLNNRPKLSRKEYLLLMIKALI